MNVSDIMTRNVACCGAGESMDSAARLMWDCDCGSIPVLRDGVVAGMITDRDICMAALTQGLPLSSMTVGSAMSRQVWTCNPWDSVADAQRLMTRHQVRRLPVISADGDVVGILSLNDVARAASAQREERRPQVTESDVARTLAATCQPRSATASMG